MMIDTIMDTLAHPFTLLCLGIAANILVALMQLSTRLGRPANPVSYVAGRPYRFALGILASFAAAGALQAADELTAIAAFGVGYAGTDVLQRLVSGVVDKRGSEKR